MSEYRCAVYLPRNAYSPREVARAADVWRVFQDAATFGSVAGGWPPERYVQEQNAFVIRKMQTTHFRQLTPKDTLTARTWVQRVRRQLVSEREIRLYVGDSLVATASQEWVHVDRSHKLSPLPQSLLDAFPAIDLGPAPPFPALDPVQSTREHTFALHVWNTWMDPLGHVNHPMYVDWCEEAIARTLLPLGISPQLVVPHAEQLQYRSGAVAGDQIAVRVQLVGVDGDKLGWSAKVLREDGTVCAEGTFVRSLSGGSARWLAAETAAQPAT